MQLSGHTGSPPLPYSLAGRGYVLQTPAVESKHRAGGIKSMSNEQINAEELDATVANLKSGVMNRVLDRAVAEVSSWQRKLEASGETDLVQVAQELLQLRAELEKGMDNRAGLDANKIGGILNKLGSRVQTIANKRGTSVRPGIEEKLRTLGGLLSNEGASISRR